MSSVIFSTAICDHFCSRALRCSVGSGPGPSRACSASARSAPASSSASRADRRAAGFYDARYAIPAVLISGKTKVTVRFQGASPGRIAPVFGVRMIRAKQAP